MKYIIGIIIFIHGAIHVLGFFKAFSIAEIRELTLPVSKLQGVAWLIVGLLFVIYLISYLSQNQFSWLAGLIAVIISQLLIIYFWKDAKFGTLPNILILVLSIISFGHYTFSKLVQQETMTIINRIDLSSVKIISENDIKRLPQPVKKWLMNSGAMGRPYITVGKVIQQAELKMKPEQKNWFHANAIQYSTIDIPAFIWSVDVKMNALLNFTGRDKFVDGKGEMLIKLNSIINIVNERGDKLNEGSIQRYLGEMVWFPSMALSEFISWEQINDTTAKATMNYKGTTGTGTFYFNTDGDFCKFSALRFLGNDKDSRRYEWILLVEEQKIFEGIRVPSKMTATWKLDEGDWTWLKLEIIDIKYNENAGR